MFEKCGQCQPDDAGFVKKVELLAVCLTFRNSNIIRINITLVISRGQNVHRKIISDSFDKKAYSLGYKQT